MKRIHSFPQILGHLAVSAQLVSQCAQSLRRAPMEEDQVQEVEDRLQAQISALQRALRILEQRRTDHVESQFVGNADSRDRPT